MIPFWNQVIKSNGVRFHIVGGGGIEDTESLVIRRFVFLTIELSTRVENGLE